MIDQKNALMKQVATAKPADLDVAAAPPVVHAEPGVGGSYTRNPDTGALEPRTGARAKQPEQE